MNNATRLAEYGRRQLPAIGQTVADSTAAAYERGWRLRILETLGDYLVSEITPGDVEEAYALWSGTPSTKNDALACLSRILHRARRDGYLLRNPVKDIELPRGSRHARSDLIARTLTPQQEEAMWEALPAEYHLPIGLMLYAGFRLGEAAGLQAQYIDLEENTLFVQWQRYRDGSLGLPKGRKTRATPIRPPLRKLITETHPDLSALGPEEFVCLTPGGANLNNSNLERALDWNSTRKKFFAGNPAWRFHDFRHHAATSFLSDGLPVNDVMEIMGHSSLQVTTRYVTPGKEAARRAVARFYPHESKGGGRQAA